MAIACILISRTVLARQASQLRQLLTSGFRTQFVASSRPPSPTSKSTTSTFCTKNIFRAARRGAVRKGCDGCSEGRRVWVRSGGIGVGRRVWVWGGGNG
eukprot:359586-Chlamydomonas_euryale.AAC.27